MFHIDWLKQGQEQEPRTRSPQVKVLYHEATNAPCKVGCVSHLLDASSSRELLQQRGASVPPAAFEIAGRACCVGVESQDSGHVPLGMEVSLGSPGKDA